MTKDLIAKFLRLTADETLTFNEVGHSRFRVNVYSSKLEDGCVVARTIMTRSAYLYYDGTDFKDLTIRA